MILTTFPRRSFAVPARRTVPTFGPRPAYGPALEGAWIDGAYRLTVDLPGVADDAVAVSVAGRTLTIDVAAEPTPWSRQLHLAPALDPEQVSARYLNGRLTVTIGRTPSPEARRITIATAPTQSELIPPAAASGDPESPTVSGAATSVTG